MDREFSGEGGRLILTADGILYGSGWDITFPYGVDYSEEKAKAAEPVKIAENVISASAGYNYALYVTEDGLLHFVGDSGLPFRERFYFDGKIKEVFAEPDRDVFSLFDEKGDKYVWGDNHCEYIMPSEHIIHDVVNDQKITLHDGKMIWEYKKDGKECRSKGELLNYPDSDRLGILKKRLGQTQMFKDLSKEYGADNIFFKYVLRSETEFRKIESPDWSSEEYEKLDELKTPYPHGEGITDVRRGAYSGREKDFIYSVGIYTFNYFIYRPVKLDDTKIKSEAEKTE